MTGNMLDRNLIFSMCDYTSRWSANFLNSTRVHNLVKTLLNSHPWPLSILPLCGIALPCTHDKVPWAVPHPPTLVHWDAFLLPSCLFHTFDRLFGHTLATPGRTFMSFWLPPWKRNIKVIAKIPLIFGHPLAKKLLYYVVDFFQNNAFCANIHF